ncbi:MAG: polysaccharide deacetylase family protein [bacterium]
MEEKSKSNLYVTFTMDCERIKRYSLSGGPETWEFSERSIRGFAELLKDYGMKGTFFIIPATAEKQRRLFGELEKEEFELGMHFHCRSFRDLRCNEPLGAHFYEEQRKILGQAKADWANALGHQPTTFRSGYVSANDATFRVLSELGFKQGSTSVPERECLNIRSVWRGACRYAHHAHPAFRLIPGSLDFLEVPITVDWEKRRPTNPCLPLELGIERAPIEDHKSTVGKNIAAMIQEKVPIKTIVAFTHNVFDYENESNTVRQTLIALMEYIWEIPQRHGLKTVPSTIEEIHLTYDKMEKGGVCK